MLRRKERFERWLQRIIKLVPCTATHFSRPATCSTCRWDMSPKRDTCEGQKPGWMFGRKGRASIYRSSSLLIQNEREPWDAAFLTFRLLASVPGACSFPCASKLGWAHQGIIISWHTNFRSVDKILFAHWAPGLAASSCLVLIPKIRCGMCNLHRGGGHWDGVSEQAALNWMLLL